MFDYLVSKVHDSVVQIADHRKTTPVYPLSDVLMSSFAMFSLKDPSVLSFVENYPERADNLEAVYHIKNIPSDNGMRGILDPVNPDDLLPVFQSLMADDLVSSTVDSHKSFPTLGGYVGIAVDGTGYFCSNTISCPHCLVKKRKSGEEYYHQLAGACVVHPDKKTVFPVFGEPITKQDGATKNDCEYNAFKRLVPKMEQVLPGEKKLILLDGLFATGPAIRTMQAHKMDFITVIKDGYVLVQVADPANKNKFAERSWYKGKNERIKCTAKWMNGLILNGANSDISVNFLQYEEIDTKTQNTIYAGKWITSLSIKPSIVKEFVKTARARWKIENETFNVLKNQGYNLEHNYGHGKKFLSSLFAVMMLLAFLVDQLTQTLDKTFQKALIEAKTMRDLRQKVRVLFDLIPCVSMNLIYKIIARDIKIRPSP